MKYILTFNTKEEAIAFKKQVLAEKSTVPHRYIIRIREGGFFNFLDTEWQEPGKQIVFEYEKETIATKKFISILIKNKAFGVNHDYTDKNVYEEDIPNITTLGTLFNGSINKETMQVIKPKNVINNLSCIEKLTSLTDISGVNDKGEYQNFFAACDVTKLRLPKTIKVIGKSAFAFCLNLKDFILPKHIESIKSRAFFDCVSLTELEIPETIKELESLVFANSSITKLNIKALTPPTIMKTTFKNMKSDFIVEVPEESYDEYLDKWRIIADHIIPSEK